uniref:Uncharacterized protein n=1 Tax=Arundo donax TaxID=35708 RepID=A0A0A9GFI7_ARUDO
MPAHGLEKGPGLLDSSSRPLWALIPIWEKMKGKAQRFFFFGTNRLKKDVSVPPCEYVRHSVALWSGFGLM